MFRPRTCRIALVSVRRLNSNNQEKKERDPRGFHYYVFDTVWNFYLRHRLIVTSAFGIVLIGGSSYIYNKTDNPTTLLPSFDSPAKLILRSFEEGRGIDAFKDEDQQADVPREKLLQDLKLILSPQKSKQYAVIVGENGCGKSTAVRKLLSSLAFPRGAVYFNCPESPESFSTDLMKVLGYVANVDIGGGWKRWFERASKEDQPVDISKEPLNSFLTIRDHLMESAELFKAKHNRPMVLVIDSADVLAKRNPMFLELLQDFAKNCADKGTLRIVFISSDGSALPLLMSRSAWSRAEKPPFEVDEIGDEEAVAFLLRRGVAAKVAEKAVKDITGGLFASLNDFVSSHKKGKSYDEIVKTLDITTDESLKKLNIKPNHPFFQRLAKDKSLEVNKALDHLKQEQIELLLKHNILAVHPNKTYTFHDRHVDVWFSKNLADKDSF